ncbi:hypothetical protein ACJJIW_09985 [Microbulbifer sp. JMSA004]|uniref:hypothetical protein n=1 Tax=Microbulbifer sp. JMSA004 TaxID=3243370 RepID=UPI00403A1A9B
MGKVTDIRDKKPRKPVSVEEAAKRAYRELYRKTPVEDEPQELISGKTDAEGRMVLEDDDDEKTE